MKKNSKSCFLLAFLVYKLIDKIPQFYSVCRYQGYRARYCISPSFRFNGRGILMYGDGEIICGEDSYVSDAATLQASPGLKILIGNRVMIANNVRMFTQTAMSDCDFSIRPIPQKVGSVIIEDYVWIGSNVYIGPGVTIGENSIVGANSVVTRSIPPGEVWGGIPARLIKIKSFRPVPGAQ